MSSALSPQQLARLALAALLSALTSLAAVALMGTSAWLIARAAQHPSASTLTLAAVAVRALALSRAILRYGERLVGHDVVLRRVADARVRVFDALRKTPDVGAAGSDVSVLVSDVEAVQDLWLRVVLPAVAALLVAVVAVAASWAVVPAAGLVLMGGLAVSFVLLPVLAIWLSRGDEQIAAWRAERQDRVVDVLHGCGDLLVYGGTDAAMQRVLLATAEVSCLERRVATRQAAVTGLGSLVQGLTTAGVGVVAAAAVVDHALDPVWLAVVVLVALASFEPVTSVAEAAGLVRSTTGSLGRVRRVMRAAGPARPAIPFVPDGLVHVRGVAHQFAGRPRPALDAPGLQLVLRPGTSVGVVGGSGAGKSTLLRVLAGELATTSGGVDVHGVPISALDPERRSALVAVASQDAHVFDSTLGDNLRIGRPYAPAEDLVEALRLVGLGGWLATLPEGLATQVGHRGVLLSGGQRKRLCVARAWLTRAPVLLLDEPTEGLEAEEADELVRAVVAASRDRAIVVVTHRVVALDHVDQVLVLDHGQLVQQGTAEQLVELDGLFARAWCLQTSRSSVVLRPTLSV